MCLAKSMLCLDANSIYGHYTGSKVLIGLDIDLVFATGVTRSYEFTILPYMGHGMMCVMPRVS